MTIEPEVIEGPKGWRRLLAMLLAVDLREKFFYLGGALLWVGLAGWSVRLATVALGAVLLAVSVFGITPSRGRGRAT